MTRFKPQDTVRDAIHTELLCSCLFGKLMKCELDVTAEGLELPPRDFTFAGFKLAMDAE